MKILKAAALLSITAFFAFLSAFCILKSGEAIQEFRAEMYNLCNRLNGEPQQ